MSVCYVSPVPVVILGSKWRASRHHAFPQPDGSTVNCLPRCCRECHRERRCQEHHGGPALDADQKWWLRWLSLSWQTFSKESPLMTLPRNYYELKEVDGLRLRLTRAGAQRKMEEEGTAK